MSAYIDKLRVRNISGYLPVLSNVEVNVNDPSPGRLFLKFLDNSDYNKNSGWLKIADTGNLNSTGIFNSTELDVELFLHKSTHFTLGIDSTNPLELNYIKFNFKTVEDPYTFSFDNPADYVMDAGGNNIANVFINGDTFQTVLGVINTPDGPPDGPPLFYF